MTEKEIIKEYLSNYKVRNIKNAKLTYSSWGTHIVQFEYNKLKNDVFVKMGLDSTDKIYQSVKTFKTKKRALKFLKEIKVKSQLITH
tara:strand:+ start:95 stop:355 length:261 start_codon:yes stop_codon:yes gene_type:complete